MIKNERTIILGIDFDGAPVQGDDPLYVNRMGPKAFLDFLEIHSGIIPVQNSQIERIASFMAVLKENKGSFPFYADSWEKAPFASAKRMLEWIDTWYLQGWSGEIDQTADSPKESISPILELAALDKASRNRVSLGIGRRLLELSTVLDKGIHITLKRLEFIDNLDDWPTAWQRVFKKLSCIKQIYNWNPAETGNKSKLKEAYILEYDSAVTALRYLSQLIDNNQSNPHFILEAEGNLRDEILSTYGNPETGARESSSNDSASQILPLALSLQKEPLDMTSLLAFLSLPVCPLGGIRYKLAESVANSGGIYGNAWKDGIEESKKLWKKWDKDESELEGFVDSWIPKIKQQEQIFSKQTAINTAERVIAFLRKSRNKHYDTALAQASLFCRTLPLLGDSYNELPWSLLEEILSLASGTATGNPLNKWEAGARRPWSSPGAIFEDIDTLVWFSPQNRAARFDWPWSVAQKSLLEANNCQFQSSDISSSRSSRLARRVLTRTKDKIIIVVPSGRNELSPATMLLRYGNITLPVVYKNIEELVFTDSSVNTKEVLKIPLPLIKGSWNIPKDISPGLDWRTSYSQTNTFIGRPAQWLLEKKAYIKTGTILSLPELTTFTGTCAHGMVEQLFIDYGDGALDLGEADFLQWFDKTFPGFLENFAYPYLETTAVQERIGFSNNLKSSIRVLCHNLKEAGAVKIKMEVPVSGKCFNASFFGKADLSFEKNDGSAGIIDMKYSTWLSGYQKKLEQDTDIQLTLYAELYKQTFGQLPETAYWLFPKEILITRQPDFFPGSRYVQSESSHNDRLSMIKTSTLWRKAQLKEGLVEIVSSTVSELLEPEENELLLPPEDGLPVEKPFDNYDPYLTLYGWRDEA
ncbi:MAG: PD-(D/E)XK nuclease family protein [Spirochaetia bacterium]|nr:PD-(D/E)XK nuclease family protein [Spirochaetia bacterium]